VRLAVGDDIAAASAFDAAEKVVELRQGLA
jgi:hypothetical protein